MLSNMPDVNKRADFIHKKWVELLGELKRTEREHTRAKKRADQVQKEKDAQRSELTKANSVKDKLEKLSRELTKENKRLKEDLRDIKETAEDRNDELHTRLEDMVSNVEAAVLQRESPDQAPVETEVDKIFREKFKSFIEQYEMREIHMASVLRSRELEIQYYIAQHDKLRKAQDAELTKSQQLTRQVSTFSQTENDLRNQLNIYVEKFKQVSARMERHTMTPAKTYNLQVEDTLNNSNDLFLTFRKEMEEMSKKTKRLEKENMQLTRKQEATNKNIFHMAEERSNSQIAIDRLAKENEKLKKLCRAMQTNGYGRVGGGAVEGAGNNVQRRDIDPDDLEETDSEYDEYRDDAGDYDDSTEEDPVTPPKRPFGPEPPPPPPPADVKQPNGVNGTWH